MHGQNDEQKMVRSYWVEESKGTRLLIPHGSTNTW